MLAYVERPRIRTIEALMGPVLLQRLDRLDVLSRKLFAGKLAGERRSKRRGRSVEFDDYRTYVPGDDLRHIDWNVFARLDRFFVKLFREEEDLALHLILDVSASMNAGTPNKLVLAARLAMALGYIGLVNHNRVLVSVIGEDSARRAVGDGIGARGEDRGAPPVRTLAPIRGRRNVQRLAAFLLDVFNAGDAGGVGWAPPHLDAFRAANGTDDADRTDPFTAGLRAIARARTGKGVAVVLSDFLIPPGPAGAAGYRAGLSYLSVGAAGSKGVAGVAYDTHCLHVLSPGELDPARERTGGQTDGAGGRGRATEAGGTGILGDLRLTDAETGRHAEVTVSTTLLKKYRAAVQRYCQDLEKFCVSRGMTYSLVRSDADVQTLLLEYLRRRGILR